MLVPMRQGMRSHQHVLLLGEGGTFALYQGLYPPKAFETAPTRDSMLTAGHKMALRAPQKLRWVLLAWVSPIVDMFVYVTDLRSPGSRCSELLLRWRTVCSLVQSL